MNTKITTFNVSFSALRFAADLAVQLLAAGFSIQPTLHNRPYGPLLTNVQKLTEFMASVNVVPNGWCPKD